MILMVVSQQFAFWKVVIIAAKSFSFSESDFIRF